MSSARGLAVLFSQDKEIGLITPLYAPKKEMRYKILTQNYRFQFKLKLCIFCW